MLIRELEKERRGYGLEARFSGENTQSSPTCGDTVTVRVSGHGFTWNGHGCSVSMAAASVIGGLDVAEFTALEADYLVAVGGGSDARLSGDLEPFAGIGRFPLRARCATLAWRAARGAIDAAASAA